MKKLMMLTGVVLVVGLSGSAFGATTITYDHVVAADGTLTSSYSGALIDTFSGTRPAWIWSGSYEVVTGALSGKYAAPYNNEFIPSTTTPYGADTTPYLSVPDPDGGSSGTASVKFGQAYNYFGLFWGSVDSYNSITFRNADTDVVTYGGANLANPANGNQTALATNRYVNFIDLPNFDEVVFTSTSFAYEIDNVAVGTAAVPVPTSILLVATGLAGFNRWRRRLVA